MESVIVAICCFVFLIIITNEVIIALTEFQEQYFESIIWR